MIYKKSKTKRILVFGVAFGIFLGATLVEGMKEIDYPQIAGVGVLLSIIRAASPRAGARKPEAIRNMSNQTSRNFASRISVRSVFVTRSGPGKSAEQFLSSIIAAKRFQ